MTDYKVLSRKYRPKKLENVIGQDFTVKALTNAFNSQKLSHAFILTGIRGVGKTTIARILAMGLNCNKNEKPTANPCGECNSCTQILDDRYEDVLEIDAASNTGVDDVREIISSLKYLPSKGSFKVFIIDEVHMLSNSAFNALLKTIEEPPSFVKFIFCTTELQKIPITIISRCQRFNLNRVLEKDIAHFLKKVTDLENIKVSEEAIRIIARYSEGSIRDSLTMLDQCLLSSENFSIDVNDVNKTIGLTSKKNLLLLFSKIVDGNIESSIDQLKKIYNSGGEPMQIIDDLLTLNYSLMSQLVSKKVDDVYNKNDIENLIEKCNIPFLNQIWQMFIKGKEEMGKISHPIEALEITIIRVAYTCKLPNLEAIVNKIKKEKNNELNLNSDNNDIGNDIKKILDIFPEGKVIKK